MANLNVKGDPRGPQNLGTANIVERGIHPDRLDEAQVTVNLTAAGVLSVAHDLGRLPKYARVLHVLAGPAGDANINVMSVNPEHWTTSQVQVRVFLLSGSIAGARLMLAVG